MIARIWHGVTPLEKSDAYLAFLLGRALPDYRSIEGNLAAFVLRRTEAGVAHFTTITHWQSRDCIVAFAGADISVAKYYPEDPDFLLAFEPSVQHFELYG